VAVWHTTVGLDEINSKYCEFAVYPPMTVAISDVPRNPTCDEIVIFQVSADSVRREVVQSDDDILTGQQLEDRWPDVQDAMLEELLTWAKLKFFSGRARSCSRNITDTRRVSMLKWDQPTVDGTAGGSQQSVAKRVIRSMDFRIAIDVTFIGVLARVTILAEAIRFRSTDVAATDISEAFLQGATYAELAELTGAKPREVNFYLPASNIPLLQKVPGFFWNFNPTTEILHCDEPGTGLVDAPRAFSLKIAEAARDKCNMVPAMLVQSFVFA
jgi:hypothetical protein